MQTLVESGSPQAFTTSWANLGGPIDSTDASRLALYLVLDVNAGQNMRVRALGKIGKDDLNTYNLPIKTVSSSDVKIEDEYFEFNDDADQNIIHEVETKGLVPYVQFQIQVGTDGGADAEVDEAHVIKSKY